MKKKLCFLVAVSPNLAFAAGNIGIALDKYMHGRDYDLLVYHSGLDGRDLAALERIPRCLPVQFFPDAKLVFFLLENLPLSCPYKSKDSLMLLCHYEIFRLLESYENAVWLDADILVQGDLSKIIDFAPFGITGDTSWLVKDQFITSPNGGIDVSGFDMDRPAFCSAVMVANDILPYGKIYDFLIGKTYEYASFLKNIDQAVINLMLQVFNILPSVMSTEKWQCIYWRNEAPFANIVHFGGPGKIWKSRELCIKFSEWYRNHLIYLELGGNDFSRNPTQFC